MKIIHIADVHWRGLSRHQEYRDSFSTFFKKARELSPDIIYVGGDIVHSKTQGISPELIDCLQWWFKELSDIAPTHVILGNHDGLIMNKDRQDAITPIVSALNDPNIYLYKKSGIYPTGIQGFNWCVFSCFDEEGWKKLEPVKDEINIALFHGGVRGSMTDSDWSIEGEVDSSFFKDYDYTLLGDIHTCQFLTEDRKVAYCGSSIQQNYGEDPGKGFLFWDIRSKDDFSVEFHEIDHFHPFVTVDWLGSVRETLQQVDSVIPGARYRIRSDYSIPQSEIIHLHRELKESKQAHEVVYKIDESVDISQISVGKNKIFKEDLRDVNTQIGLVREFYRNSELSDEEWENLEGLMRKYFSRVMETESSLRNVKWSIKKASFDNMFAYGKSNTINFEKLGGITGIFGKNRSGKSSIVGTLMYGLFNTTDRGPVKNLHIINTRKGYCKTSLDIGLSGKNIRVERQSVKHENRKGQVHATTHLNVHEIDKNGEEVRDLTEEQRRETEKVIRKKIGNPEDFLITSLASQGGMNNFIKERATQRKIILTKFLDLNMFEQMEAHAKEDLAFIKNQMKAIPDRDWDLLIYNSNRSIKNSQAKIRRLDDKIEKLRSQSGKLQVEIASFENCNQITQTDIDQQESTVKNIKEKIKKIKVEISSSQSEITSISEKIKKIQDLKCKFPIDSMRERLSSQRDLEKTLRDLEHQRDLGRQLLNSKKKLAKKLEPCDCFEHLPSCQYVKESDKHNKLLKEQVEKTSALVDSVKAARRALKTLLNENLEDKIDKYEKVLQRESEHQIAHVEFASKNRESQTALSRLKESLVSAETTLSEMKSVSLGSSDSPLDDLKKKLYDTRENISILDSDRLNISQDIGRLKSDLKSIRAEKKSYLSLKDTWRVYSLFSQSVSKKGIPLQIINSYLPVINSEISKILQNNVGFTVELEADLNTNAMDIYINYGDSKRIIELASGMEKMISSLAIRVALINVSSLPRCDMFIIDEGFGTLDDMNVEACNRLLISLKKYFKNILIISHVDAVKDVVDNVIDITKKGKDARVNIC
jgi:DNA repair exonuclease SbcCD ATPase subunit